MWGWLSGIVDSLTAVKEGILQIPVTLGEKLDNLKQWLSNLWHSITDLPNKIGDTLKSIFVPDTDEMQNTIDTMVDNISDSIGIKFDTLDNLFNNEQAITSVNTMYQVPGVAIFGNLPILDATYIVKAVDHFRPYIRGFIVLLLVFFNWRNVMGLIGQNPEIAHNAQQNYQKWRDENDS